MRGQVLNLFGVTLRNGLAIFAGLILLIIPGIWLAHRLITCLPADYDLRVRKEAFDLQLMLNPSALPAPGPGTLPSILS
jgi:hypothetical protein